MLIVVIDISNICTHNRNVSTVYKLVGSWWIGDLQRSFSMDFVCSSWGDNLTHFLIMISCFPASLLLVSQHLLTSNSPSVTDAYYLKFLAFTSVLPHFPLCFLESCVLYSLLQMMVTGAEIFSWCCTDHRPIPSHAKRHYCVKANLTNCILPPLWETALRKELHTQTLLLVLQINI